MTELSLVANVGSPEANSYGTLAEMNLYFSGRSDAVEFLEATEQEKIARLIQATVINDLLLHAVGNRTTEEQSLEFPRTNLVDSHGRKYSSNEIPAKIKYAQFEQALYLFTTSIKMPSILTQGFSQAKLDVMSVTVDKSFIPNKLDTDALDFLREFGMVDSGSVGSVHTPNVVRY
jgi:hypothetical protein